MVRVVVGALVVAVVVVTVLLLRERARRLRSEREHGRMHSAWHREVERRRRQRRIVASKDEVK